MSDRNKRIKRTFRAVEGDWRRVDLHLHTSASADWLEPGSTYLQWMQKAEARGLDIVAITDHNTVEGVARLRSEIERLTWLEANDRLRPQERRDLDEYRRLGDKILVLPGFEFTATFGFHILAIFPPETPLRTLELLLLRLNVPVDRLTEGSTEVGATADVLTAYRLIGEAGGISIAAHANSAHGVGMRGLSFGGQTKIAFTQDPNLHALEVTDLEDTGRRATAHFFDGSKPEYPRQMHCIQGSDAHRLVRDPRDKNRPGIGDRVTEVLIPDISFEALKALFEGDDFTRTRPYRPLAEQPFDHIEAAREKGNNIVQAFHESMAREAGRLHKVLCDAVAFANTSGGTIYIGVSAARKGAPKGVENPEAAMVFLKRELERNITPPVDARVEVVLSQGVPVMRVTVPNAPDKPYTMNQTRIYVRQEAETNEAVRDEIVQLVFAGRATSVTPVVEPPAVQTPVVEAANVSATAPELIAVPEMTSQPMDVESDGLQLPGIGVEIVSTEERKGTRYFTIRDLRNSNTVQNVTLASARKLWSYAINQYLTNTVDLALVQWEGPFGVWQASRRAKKMRYDLALRQPDGSVRVFYGVTVDGMTGPWMQFLQAEDKADADAAAETMSASAGRAVVAAKPPVARTDKTPVVAADAPAATRTTDTPAEVKAKPRTRSRRAKPKPEPVASAPAELVVDTAPATDPLPAEETPARIPVVVVEEPAVEAVPPVKSRSRSRKPKATAAVVADAPPAKAPAKPRSRSRSRKPKLEEIPAAEADLAAPDA